VHSARRDLRPSDGPTRKLQPERLVISALRPPGHKRLSRASQLFRQGDEDGFKFADSDLASLRMERLG
jgi:hypothetical protein